MSTTVMNHVLRHGISHTSHLLLRIDYMPYFAYTDWYPENRKTKRPRLTLCNALYIHSPTLIHPFGGSTPALCALYSYTHCTQSLVPTKDLTNNKRKCL